MSSTPVPAPVDTSVPPVPEPAPVPVPQPAPIPVPGPQPAPQYASGGAAGSGNSFTRFFDDISVSDVAIYGLTFLTLFMMIYYYRKKILQLKEDKPVISQLQSKVSEVESNVKSMMGENYIAA
jgi:hypothetical protein